MTSWAGEGSGNADGQSRDGQTRKWGTDEPKIRLQPVDSKSLTSDGFDPHAGERTHFRDETGIPEHDPQTRNSGVQVVGPEGLGKQVLERDRDRAGAVADTEHLGVGTELVEDLAAGTAGRGRRLGWRIDQGSPDPQRALGSGDRLKDGGALGTDGQAVRGILDVATGEDFAAVRQDGRADGELAVGR